MKIQGKFYPLTGDVTTKLRKGKLTAAEWRIWSYLVEIDPWGDRYQDINSLDVMSKCDCSRATFYRAIAKFQKLKIFDIQDQGFSIRNLTGASLLKSSQAEEQETKLNQVDLRNEKVVSKMRLDSQKRESCLKNETEFSKMRLDSQICENKPPETPPGKGLKSSQTLQTYSDFKDSLSESEREKFFNFVKEKTNNLEKPINDLEAWLASKNAAKQNRWEIYYRTFQEEQINESKKTTRHSENEGKLSPSKMQRAIAEFKRQRQINQPVDEPENVNSESRLSGQNLPIQEGLAPNTIEEYHHSTAEVNKLLDNPPERFESRAQTHRERIAKVKRQQAEIRRANREAAESRAKQQNPDLEQRKLETLRQIEEMNQLQSSQNSDPDEEDGSNE